MEKVQRGIETQPRIQTPTIKLSHIELLHSISQHSIGLQWLKQTKSWNLCIQYYTTSSTIFILKQAGIFLFDVLMKFSEQMKDEKLVNEIIETIMEPLSSHKAKRQSENSNVVNDENHLKTLTPCLKIVNNILTSCIESKKRTRTAYCILLKQRYENNMWVASDLVWENEDFFGIIHKGLMISNFVRLSSMDIPSSDTESKDLALDVHAIHFYNIMNSALTRRCFKNVNMLCEMHHQLWHKLGSLAPPEVVLENQDLRYGDQVVMIQTLPIIYVIKSRYKANTEYINDLCTKMFNMSCQHTIRLLYHYRDSLTNENLEFVAELASNSIQTILASKHCLIRERATLAFQILIYVLKGYVDDPSQETGEKRSCNSQLVLQAPNLLSALLIGLNDMIKFYKFTWSECVESTAIVPLLLVLLDNQNLSSRVSFCFWSDDTTN